LSSRCHLLASHPSLSHHLLQLLPGNPAILTYLGFPTCQYILPPILLIIQDPLSSLPRLPTPFLRLVRTLMMVVVEETLIAVMILTMDRRLHAAFTRGWRKFVDLPPRFSGY
jgi:hypothetical protein